MSDPTRSLSRIFSKIEKTVGEAITKPAMKDIGEFAVDLVVKRTRLGYSVPVVFGTKDKLKGLSSRYIKHRERFKDLSPTTAPKKSNLTLTGQMLASVKVIQAANGRVRFGPTGGRKRSTLTNLEVATYQERQGRPFNRLSALEFQQVLRHYRREFGDLLKKRKLIR